MPGKIQGTISAIDSFGNLITDITAEMLADAPTDERVRIECDEHETLGIFKAYADQPAMTLLALIGSNGCSGAGHRRGKRGHDARRPPRHARDGDLVVRMR